MADVSKIKLPNNTVVNVKDYRISGVDTAPTSGSSNVVTSGGVYTAVQNAIGSVYRVKGTKATYAELPSSGNVAGDVWNVTAAYGNYPPGTNWVWTGSAWDALGGSVDLSGCQPLDADLTAIAGLSGTSGLLKKTAANTWSLDTNKYLYGTSNDNITRNNTTETDTWATLGYEDTDNRKFNLKVVRHMSGVGAHFGGTDMAYGNTFFFGGGDTRAYMSVKYGAPLIVFGGGSLGTTSASSAPNWYMGLKGTSGTTYNLATIATQAANGNSAYNSLSTTVGSSEKPVYLNAGTITQVSSIDGRIVGGYVGHSNSGYLVTHPESANSIITPYIYNDLAFLITRGGEATMYLTTASDFTVNTLTVASEIGSGSDLNNMFDASPSYYGFGTAGTFEDVSVVIDITLPTALYHSCVFYIDFGNATWGFQNIEVLTRKNADTSYTYWAQAASTNASSQFRYKFNNASTGLEKIRIRLYNKYNSTTSARIAQIGLINYGSAGVRNTYMSRGVNDRVWRSISPATNNTYSLGESSYRWSNVYSVLGNFSGAVTAGSSINFSTASNAADTSKGINFSSTNASAHIGCDSSSILGLYSNYNIVIRPNGASSTSKGGSVEITSSGTTIYKPLTATSFIKSGGTASQFLKADGSVDSTSYATVSALNNKQDTLTFDTIPTASSTNPVTSGGLNTEFGKVSYIGDNLGQETYVDSGSVVTDLSGYATKAWVEAKGYLTTESDPGVYAWAKAATKPTYTASEVGALPNTTTIPSKTSQLTNDAGFITGYTFDNTPTANSSNPVKSGGVYSAISAVRQLPAVSSSDNGKILKVVNGVWTAVADTTPTFYSGSSAPSSSLGNNGDIYLQTS